MSTLRRTSPGAERDPDMAGAEAAMHRAARRARRRTETAARIAAAEQPREPEAGAAAAVETLRELREAGLDAGAAHLRDASGCIGAGDWAGAVRESLHAVESVARQLDPAASGAPGPALDSLEKRGRLHPALKKAFGELHGCTSDERGVRDSRPHEPKSPVGRDEAVFMLGACAAFAGYLRRKNEAGDSR